MAVQSLDLMCNNIEAEGAEHVAKSLHVGKEWASVSTLLNCRLVFSVFCHELPLSIFFNS